MISSASARQTRLTGLPGPERLTEFLDNEWRRSRRNGSPLSLVLIDVEIERAGELEGVLLAVASALRGISAPGRRPAGLRAPRSVCGCVAGGGRGGGGGGREVVAARRPFSPPGGGLQGGLGHRASQGSCVGQPGGAAGRGRSLPGPPPGLSGARPWCQASGRGPDGCRYRGARLCCVAGGGDRTPRSLAAARQPGDYPARELGLARRRPHGGGGARVTQRGAGHRRGVLRSSRPASHVPAVSAVHPGEPRQGAGRTRLRPRGARRGGSGPRRRGRRRAAAGRSAEPAGHRRASGLPGLVRFLRPPRTFRRRPGHLPGDAGAPGRAVGPCGQRTGRGTGTVGRGRAC